MVAEEIARRLAAAAAEGVIKEATVQVFVVQPGIQSAAVLAQVGDGGGFVGKPGRIGAGRIATSQRRCRARCAAGWRPPVASGASLF